MKSLSVFVLLVAGLVGYASACGMVTHNLIAQRARQWFLNPEDPTGSTAMLNAHIDALQGGAPFPV